LTMNQLVMRNQI